MVEERIARDGRFAHRDEKNGVDIRVVLHLTTCERKAGHRPESNLVGRTQSMPEKPRLVYHQNLSLFGTTDGSQDRQGIEDCQQQMASSERFR